MHDLAVIPSFSDDGDGQIVCVQVVKLSDTVQAFPRSVVCCVHGAAPKFLEYGDTKSKLEPGKRCSLYPLFAMLLMTGIGQPVLTPL